MRNILSILTIALIGCSTTIKKPNLEVPKEPKYEKFDTSACMAKKINPEGGPRRLKKRICMEKEDAAKMLRNLIKMKGYTKELQQIIEGITE